VNEKINHNELAVDIPPIFARHLVSVGCWDQTKAVVERNGGHPYLHSFSAFVVSINEAPWSLMTAGHAIRDVERYIEQGHVLTDWHIDDSPIGMPPAGLPVPLEWAPEYIAVLHDDTRGADFALIPLNGLQRASLESNGVTPITDSQTEFSNDWVRWYVLGLPAAKARTDHGRQVIEKHFIGLPVQPLPARPAWWPNENQHDMLYGELIPVGDSSIDGLDIAGMSGGPVVGLRFDAAGKAEWKVIGIQSGWVSTRRVISVCAAWPVFNAIGRLIDDARNVAVQGGT
jgi:hypothetical protein